LLPAALQTPTTRHDLASACGWAEVKAGRADGDKFLAKAIRVALRLRR
jgi:hypothetical protein